MTWRCILAALVIWSLWAFLLPIAVISAPEVAICVPKSPCPRREVNMEMPLAGHAGFSAGLANQSPATKLYIGILSCRRSTWPKKSRRQIYMPDIRYCTSFVNNSCLVGATTTTVQISDTSVLVPTPQTIYRCIHLSAEILLERNDNEEFIEAATVTEVYLLVAACITAVTITTILTPTLRPGSVGYSPCKPVLLHFNPPNLLLPPPSSPITGTQFPPPPLLTPLVPPMPILPKGHIIGSPGRRSPNEVIPVMKWPLLFEILSG